MHGGLASLSAPFEFSSWNDGRIISWAPGLQEWLVQTSFPDAFSLTNAPLSSMLDRSADAKMSSGKKNRSVKDITPTA